MSTTTTPNKDAAATKNSDQSNIKPSPEEPKTPTFHRFLKLPIELRQLVYGFAFLGNRPLIPAHCRNSGFGLGPAEEHGPIFEANLFCASKQVYQELRISEGTRSTIWEARHPIVLQQPQRHVYKDRFVFDFEFPRFRHLETLYLILYTAINPKGGQEAIDQAERDLGPLAKLWVGREATIEWRNTGKIEQTPGYLREQEAFESYLRSLEKAIVKG